MFSLYGFPETNKKYNINSLDDFNSLAEKNPFLEYMSFYPDRNDEEKEIPFREYIENLLNEGKEVNFVYNKMYVGRHINKYRIKWTLCCRSRDGKVNNPITGEEISGVWGKNIIHMYEDDFNEWLVDLGLKKYSKNNKNEEKIEGENVVSTNA